MIMDGYKSIPGFRHQLVQTEFGDGKRSTRDILTYGRKIGRGANDLTTDEDTRFRVRVSNVLAFR